MVLALAVSAIGMVLLRIFLFLRLYRREPLRIFGGRGIADRGYAQITPFVFHLTCSVYNGVLKPVPGSGGAAPRTVDLGAREKGGGICDV